VCYVEHLAPPPKPKRKRATSAQALEKAPKQPAPTLRTLNEKLEGLSDIVRGMEKSNNLRDKLIEGMDKQLGISFKLIRSLRSDKDKLEAEIPLGLASQLGHSSYKSFLRSKPIELGQSLAQSLKRLFNYHHHE
jgi:hypothetical protein